MRNCIRLNTWNKSICKNRKIQNCERINIYYKILSHSLQNNLFNIRLNEIMKYKYIH